MPYDLITLEDGTVYTTYNISVMFKLQEICATLGSLAEHSKDEATLHKCEDILKALFKLDDKDFVPKANPDFKPFRSFRRKY